MKETDAIPVVDEDVPPVEVRSEAFIQTGEVCQFLTLAAVLYILATNIHPGLTTLQACWSSQTSDNICLLVAFFLCSQVESWCLIRLNLSSGSLTCICSVSGIMPKNVKQWDGPSNLSRVRGIPSCSDASIIISKFL